jgi:hypothetical protein
MRFAPALVILAVVVPLAACSPTAAPAEPVAPPPSRGWAAPVLFSTEEEALAAATDAYTKYVETGEAILKEGGSDAGRLRQLSTQEWFETINPSYEEFQSTGNHLEGASRVVEIRLQRWSAEDVALYACRDYSEVRVVSPDGQNVTPADRPRFATFEVSFVVVGKRVLLSRDDLWSQGEWCF